MYQLAQKRLLIHQFAGHAAILAQPAAMAPGDAGGSSSFLWGIFDGKPADAAALSSSLS